MGSEKTMGERPRPVPEHEESWIGRGVGEVGVERVIGSKVAEVGTEFPWAAPRDLYLSVKSDIRRRRDGMLPMFGVEYRSPEIEEVRQTRYRSNGDSVFLIALGN